MRKYSVVKIILVLLCACMAFCSCGAPETSAVLEAVPDSSAPPPAAPPEPPESGEPQEPEEPEADPGPEVYTPVPGMSPEQTVEDYFREQYTAYLNLEDVDCTAIIDMSKQINRRMLQWISILNQRRRLLKESGLCYVDTEERKYEIIFDEQPEDDRMDKWHEWMDLTGYVAVHFHIEGEKGEAYPPFMAVNSQHTMFFREVGGIWKLTQHFFPGALRKYLKTGDIEEPDDDETLMLLEEEFAADEAPSGEPAPDGFDAYDPSAAAGYAALYAEEKNPDFYDIGDWTGNCANFVSQCVWAGFGEGHMDSRWYGGSSGTAAWENVNYFWDYITDGTGLRGEVFTGAEALREGDIVQMRSLSDPDGDRYTHTMIVVDEEKLILAQNTPACFAYYSDLANMQVRFIRPLYAVNGR